MNDLAPIALFVFNRPGHTEKTIKALMANPLAIESVLYVFADGPRDQNDTEKTEKVLLLINSISGFKEVYIKKSAHNQGLAQSIIGGVTEVIKKHGKIIVLEDDLETSPGFLAYMNDALYMYEKDAQVMHVSGYVLPISDKLPETFFFNQTSCWGWGTWERAWSNFCNDPVLLKKELFHNNKMRIFNIDNSYNYLKQLQENIDGVIKTWAVKWQATVVLRKGLCLHPYKSLVQNKGLDWSGMHTGPMQEYVHNNLVEAVNVNRIELIESEIARKAMVSYYKKFYSKKSAIIKSLKKMINRLKIIIPNSIKQKLKIILQKESCPFCYCSLSEQSIIGLDFAILKEKQVIGGGKRHAGCSNCGSTDRERLIYLYLKENARLFKSGKSKNILHIAPENNLSKKMLDFGFENYVCGDLFAEGYYYPSHVKNINIQSIPFADNFFDLIICNHVLEHLPDDLLAMNELRRVLKKSGQAILQVPISKNSATTYEDFSVTEPAQRELIFGQNDHVRIYGQDYTKRLEKACFNVKRINIYKKFKKYGINKDEDIFVCTK